MNLSKKDKINFTKQVKDKCLVNNQNLKFRHHKSTLILVGFWVAGPPFLCVYIHVPVCVCVCV